jgi:hypothetical protein
LPAVDAVYAKGAVNLSRFFAVIAIAGASSNNSSTSFSQLCFLIRVAELTLAWRFSFLTFSW